MNGSEFKQWRILNNMSQTDVSKLLGYGNPSRICQMESSEKSINKRTVTMIKVLDAFPQVKEFMLAQ
jgi:transcriptional regulator with XRE-family HTH domain